MFLREHVDIAPFSSLGTGGTARYFADIVTRDDVKEAALEADVLGVRLHVAGEGTNTVYADGELPLLVAKMGVRGFEVASESAAGAVVRIGAGENWDAVVERTVGMGLSGIEALSAIPGSAGAAPVQNIGAYGSEAKDTIVEVEAYDLSSRRFVSIEGSGCRFGYRRSIFNSGAKGRFVIVSVALALSKRPPSIPDYAGVKAYFDERRTASPSLSDIRNAIREIRRSKLPDPSVVPNAGSFFKNPIVPTDAFERLRAAFPGVPSFPAEEGVKVPAGWLIERAGLKGRSFGKVGTYERNALVLVNLGGATSGDVLAARDEIREAVARMFGIELAQEPVLVP